MKVKLVTAINDDIGTGHISRMSELKIILVKKFIDTEIFLIDKRKNIKFLKKNKIKFKNIDISSYKKKNYFYIVDLPNTFKRKYLKEKFGKNMYFYDRKNYSKTIKPMIIHKNRKMTLYNYYIPKIKNKFKKKYDILITSGSVTKIKKNFINQNLENNFKLKIINPFLKVKSNTFLSKLDFIKEIKKSHLVICNFGVTVFEALLNNVPVIINNYKKKDIEQIKKLKLSTFNEIELNNFNLKDYKKRIFLGNHILDNNEVIKLIKNNSFTEFK